jgi:hypothetical protein
LRGPVPLKENFAQMVLDTHPARQRTNGFLVAQGNVESDPQQEPDRVAVEHDDADDRDAVRLR